MSIQQVGINILINSIPEEFVVAMLILILLGRYDYLDKENWKQNLFRVITILVLPIAIISDINMFIFKISENLNLLINIFLFSIGIFILNPVKSIKQFLKVMLMVIIGIMLFMISEIITIVIVHYGFNLDISNFNNQPFLNFVILIPERLIQYGFLIYVLIKKNSLKQVSVSKLIMNNKILKNIVVILTLFNIGILIFTWKYLILNNILSSLQLQYQLYIIIVIISLIIINILTILLMAICIYPKEKYLQEFRKED